MTISIVPQHWFSNAWHSWFSLLTCLITNFDYQSYGFKSNFSLILFSFSSSLILYFARIQQSIESDIFLPLELPGFYVNQAFS